MIKISEYSLDGQIYATFRKLKTFGKLSNASSRFFFKKTARHEKILLCELNVKTYILTHRVKICILILNFTGC